MERRHRESTNGGTFKELERMVKEYSTQQIRLKTKRDLQETSTADEQKALSTLNASRGEV